MTKDANNKGYHCGECGKECGYLGCPDCDPEYSSSLEDAQRG